MKHSKLIIQWLLSTLLALYTGSATAESIASKIETLGDLKNVSVTSIKVRQTAGLLNIQAELGNANVSSQPVFYRFKWLDSAGFDVWGEETWKTMTLYGKQKSLINAVAPTPQATDFRMELQTPGNKTPLTASDKEASPIPGH